jgi:thiol-disulfide isomerase/thioredoxin
MNLWIKHPFFLCGLMAFLLPLFTPLLGQGAPIKNPNPVLRSGDFFPKTSFPNVLTPEDKKYLGVGVKKTFSTDEIHSDLVVIKFLNTNCTYCIRLLPTFKEIYRLVEENQNLKAKTRMIGIGAGDTFLEIEELKKKHPVPYPVVADPEFKAHKAVGEPRVPFIVVARKDKQKQWVVATVNVGLIFSAEHFIGELKAILNIDPETLKLKKPSQ